MLVELCAAISLLTAAAGPPPDLTAFVAQVRGRPSAESPGGRTDAVVPRQVLPGNWRVTVPPGAEVLLICSSDRRVDLEAGPKAREIERRVGLACASGEPLLPATYQALAGGPRNLAVDRSVKERSLVLEVRTRGSEEDDPRIPVLLSPRETAIAQARPGIRWTAVDGAKEYLLELVGPKAWTVHVPADDAHCRVEEHPPGKLKLCAAAWPRDAPDLAPGPASYLAVGARAGRLGNMRTGELWSVRLREGGGRELEASLQALRSRGLSGAEESFREAVLYESSGLRSDAASALQRSLLETPSAPAYLLQATLELEVSLPVAALRSLREAARLADDPTLSAEVEKASAAARRLLEDDPGEEPHDGDPEAGARLVESLREQGVQDLYGLRLGDALRHFDAAVRLAEDSGLPDLAASVRLYRGFVRALLRRDDAESDLEESSRRIAAKAPELAPFLSALPSSVLGLASGDLDLVVAGLEKTGREYHDRLPPTYFQGLKLISLLRAERYAEAAATCRRLLSSPGLAATHPSKSATRALGLSCSISERLDRTARHGADEEEIEDLSRELMAAVADQPVPLRGPLRGLLEQIPGKPTTEAGPGSWASRIELGSSLGQLYDLVKNVPVPLREGLDSDLAAFAEELIALKARAGAAATAFALGETVRSRAHLDGLAPEAPDPAEPRDRAPGPPAEDSPLERNPPCP